MDACSGHPYHDLRRPANNPARMARCRRRREWRGVVIPEAEHCEYVKLCDTDRLALGDVLPMY